MDIREPAVREVVDGSGPPDDGRPAPHRSREFGDDVRAVVDDRAADLGWSYDDGDFWFYVMPPGHVPRPQGWKLHVSAVPDSAEDVLAAAAGVLVEHQASFKVARTFEQLLQLTDMRCDRASGGKFITVYPDDDDHFRTLAKELHDATDGMAGPAILSDRPYVPGSIVQYRYGGFSGAMQKLSNDGNYMHTLTAPDGQLVEDERNPWYSAPEWATDPLDTGASGVDGGTDRPTQVLLADRFVVTAALMQSNRGGVYRAQDRETGRDVVVKQARPHTASYFGGTDARDGLRAEAAALERFAALGIAPRLQALFEYQDCLFLAEDLVEGTSLRGWTGARVHGDPERRMDPSDVAHLLPRIAELVHVVHTTGTVLRDFNPNNVMVTPDRDVVLIDPEYAVPEGAVRRAIMTHGYTAPEQAFAAEHQHVADRRADLYSLGATLLFATTGVDPLVLRKDDDHATRDHRIDELLDSLADVKPQLVPYREIVRGLMRSAAEDRTPLPAVRERLARAAAGERVDAGTRVPVGSARLDEAGVDTMIEDGLAVLAEAATPREEFLFPLVRAENRVLDPAAVQGGAAGVVELLRRAYEQDPTDARRELLESTSGWLARRLNKQRTMLPGLYFGHSGAVWALYEAGRTLDDDERTGIALDVAERIPSAWPNPDLTHGASGSGTLFAHLVRRTGDERFRTRLQRSLDAVTARARRVDGGLVWEVSAEFASKLAGLRHLGFAHGVAGISNFLLDASRVLDDAALLETAVGGARILADTAEPAGDGLLWRPGNKRPDEAEEAVAWWCSGSGGIGAFLTRLWRVTGDDAHLDLARRAAVAVRHEAWHLGNSHCHGVAGNAELLLDLAAVTGDPVYRTWAFEHARVLHQRSTVRSDGRRVPRSEDGRTDVLSYNIGLAGPVAFLHRLRHGGTRPFQPDDFSYQPGGGTAAADR